MGIFHIDPLKNTSSDGTNGGDDDIIVTEDGNVGLGTLKPQARLHIKTKGTPANPIPGFQMVIYGTDPNIPQDYGMGENATVMNDAFLISRQYSNTLNGVATWEKDGINPVLFKRSKRPINSLPLYGTTKYYNTGGSITLSRGKWVVMVVLLVTLTNYYTTKIPYSFSFDVSLSDTNLENGINGEPSAGVANLSDIISPDLIGNKSITGSFLTNTEFPGLIIGSLIVDNKTTPPFSDPSNYKTYYIAYGGINSNIPSEVAIGINKLNFDWGEDYIVAYRIPGSNL